MKACEHFSDIYRRERGLCISYQNQNRIGDMLQNATKQNVKVIVVTNVERILVLGGMDILIGKLSHYCTLPAAALVLPMRYR